MFIGRRDAELNATGHEQARRLARLVCHYGTIRCAMALGHPRGLGAWREFQVRHGPFVALPAASHAGLAG